MTLGIRDSRERRKRKFRLTAAKWIFALGVIVLAGVFAYQTGSGLAKRETSRLKQRIAELSATIDGLQASNSELKTAADVAQQRLRDSQQRYQRDVPTGAVKEVFELARDKLSDGLDPARLRFVIEAAQNQRQCEDDLATKRFIVPTPLYKGANNSVGFARGTVTVTAAGQSARDSAGNAEGRFDPAQPVTVSFGRIGGAVSEVSGVLPLHHSVVVDDQEFRFSLVAGPPGFLLVTGDRCAYP